jgi:hypothetical protein
MFVRDLFDESDMRRGEADKEKTRPRVISCNIFVLISVSDNLMLSSYLQIVIKPSSQEWNKQNIEDELRREKWGGEHPPEIAQSG